ncbi:hypothetical protein LOTGIDRAFT_159528 [Lottia gigantea]|uniref:Chitin-binding type-4 domain-containing protein n=1 Tax=Lottia gigantea TaxID=225164 RepID=V4AK64_LOTGI|nr:hypothetical protein LOTGIDRAFT_159528 [Lottia gigantea]ESO97487.1 hypothetical protein LOTGIDRAFT_159528 [Lottia gigantea]
MQGVGVHFFARSSFEIGIKSENDFASIFISYARLVEPPNRSSLWRDRVPWVRYNYYDYSINCGEEYVPYIADQKYWCGVCGDPLNGAQSHLYGGNYVRRYIISRKYPKGYKFISVTVETNVRQGLFEFFICPHEFSSVAVNHSCFENHRLKIKGFGDVYYVINPGVHKLRLVIPTDFRCNHCVLKWRFLTANYSRYCYSHPVRRMCIHPEEYINCANIAIGTNWTSSSLKHL